MMDRSAGNVNICVADKPNFSNWRYSLVPINTIRLSHNKYVHGEYRMAPNVIVTIKKPVMVRVINSDLFNDLAVFMYAS